MITQFFALVGAVVIVLCFAGMALIAYAGWAERSPDRYEHHE